MNDELQSLRQRIRQLDDMQEGGALSPQLHRKARAGLEEAIVANVLAQSDVEARTGPNGASKAVAASTPARRAIAALRAPWAAVALFVLAAGGAGYWWTGSPGAWSGAPGGPGTAGTAGMAGVANPAPHPMGNDGIAAMVQGLADRLKAQPADAQGWAMLARSYASLGRHGDALPAYARALELTTDDAALVADYADELALQQGRRLAGEPMAWVKKALAIDPGQPKALLLAGTEAFDRQDYALAIQHWTRVVQAGPAESELVKQARAGLEDARRLGGGAMVVADARAPKAATPDAVPVTGTARISGTLSLDPKLAARTQPTDTVFIFARAPQGSRMPLAMLQRQVKDLPLRFELDDSTAMTPQGRLSGVREAVVGARVSRSGQAVAQPGDLEAMSGAVPVGTSDLQLQVARVVQ